MGSLRNSRHVMTCHRFALATASFSEKKKNRKEEKRRFVTTHSDEEECKDWKFSLFWFLGSLLLLDKYSR